MMRDGINTLSIRNFTVRFTRRGATPTKKTLI